MMTARLARMAPAVRGLPLVAVLGARPANRVAEILDAGFDDVLGADVSALELLARVRAIRRRFRDGAAGGGCPPVALRRAEANILDYLASHADRVVSQREIIDRVLGGPHTSDASLVRVHIASLRKKLGDARHLVRTARGRGYVVDAEQLRRWRVGPAAQRWI
jgi:DNA-binding response OmpR family regulator